MTDPLETIREDVHQKSAQEFVRRQHHHFFLLRVLIVLVGESYLPVFQFDQAIVGNRDSMSIASQVIQNALRTAEWRLGVNDPFDLGKFCQILGELFGITQLLQITVEPQLSGRKGSF